jgi:F-type H+-transporting ATPase subunit a
MASLFYNIYNFRRFLKSFFFGMFSIFVSFWKNFFLNKSFIFFGIIFSFIYLFNYLPFYFYFIFVELVGFNILNIFISKFYYESSITFHLFFITNLDLFLGFNLIFLFFYGFLSLNRGLLIPDYSQAKLEFLYNFIAQTGFSHNGWKGQRHFVFFVVLFLFILVSNFLGCGVILSITILAISKNGLSWFQFFFPNLPIFILPLFTCIEFVSYISRAFSLAIRLFANLMSGHTLLNILTGFILKIGSKGFFSFLIALIPFFLISAIILLEMVIAVLQAYVFVTLVAIYLKDAYSVGH